MKQDFRDELKDKLLNISTTGRDDKTADDDHSPYEPTAYAVLDRILESGYINQDSVVVDMGCGKGRVALYFSHQCGCKAFGIDIEERFIRCADHNREILNPINVSFVCGSAEHFKITDKMDNFYFFNPFSYDIFRGVLSKIVTSYYECPREIHLIFYYPSDEYMGRLMTEEKLMFVDEIDCRDLFEGKDEREKVVIFEIG